MNVQQALSSSFGALNKTFYTRRSRSLLGRFSHRILSRDMGVCFSRSPKRSDVTEAVLLYWLGDPARFRKTWDPCTTPENQAKWFMKNDDVDREIKDRFGAEVERLPETIASVSASGTTDDRIAAIILGDQMSRNIYRGSKDMYRWDSIVLPLAKSVVANEEAFMTYPLTFKLFSLLPLMHSEDVVDQRACCAWVERVREAVPEGEEGASAREFLDHMSGYAKAHCEIVERWGRFPHRNEILGRESTAEEAKGLADGTIQAF